MLRFSLRPWGISLRPLQLEALSSKPSSKAFKRGFAQKDRQLSREKLANKLRENVASLLPPSPVLRDIHDLMFEYEQVGPVFPRQPHHVLVVVFDPSSDHFPVRQLDTHQLLLLAQGFQIGGLFQGFFRRRSLPSSHGA